MFRITNSDIVPLPGEGQFGKVYTAVNNSTGDLMAMKEVSVNWKCISVNINFTVLPLYISLYKKLILLYVMSYTWRLQILIIYIYIYIVSLYLWELYAAVKCWSNVGYCSVLNFMTFCFFRLSLQLAMFRPFEKLSMRWPTLKWSVDKILVLCSISVLKFTE